MIVLVLNKHFLTDLTDLINLIVLTDLTDLINLIVLTDLIDFLYFCILKLLKFNYMINNIFSKKHKKHKKLKLLKIIKKNTYCNFELFCIILRIWL